MSEKFGWCLVGDHEHCMATVGLKCKCDHKGHTAPHDKETVKEKS